jgi:hypothetical protein
MILGEVLPFLIIGGVIAVVLVGIGAAMWYEKKRREELASLAEELGLAFQPEGDAQLHRQVGTFALFSQGGARKINNLILGETDEVKIALFDYQFTTGSGKQKQTHRQTVASLQSPSLKCPPFSMRPEGMFDKIGGAFGMQDIDFESHPLFSSMFLLKGDETQVRKFFTPEVLSFFETQKGISVEARPGALIFYRARTRVKPAEMKNLLAQAYEIFGFMVDQTV